MQKTFWFSVLVGLLFGSRVGGQELPSLEDAAKKVQASTVTVRVNALRVAKEGDTNAAKVSVFSGVSLGNGLVITPLFSPDNVTVRITVPGGEQAEADARVLDEPSGLALLKVTRDDIPKLELADESPRVGSWILSGAAWGAEKPLVAFGLVSGVDRTIPGTRLPPLLQCDLTTTKTSSGGPIVNQKGHLTGVIVATDKQNESNGWTYAIPVSHVRRMLRVNDEKFGAKKDRKDVVIIQWRRPVVGMEIGGELDEVVVKRVTKGGPAARAGIKVGDRIVAVDGLKVRSPYQAVSPTLFKQPGDTATFLVEQDNGSRSIEVVLGGGVAVPRVGGPLISQLIEPKIIIDGLVLRNASNKRKAEIAEVFGSEEALKAMDPDERKLLEKAVDRYQTVIEIQQRRLMRQEQELKAIEAENAALKRRLEAAIKAESD